MIAHLPSNENRPIPGRWLNWPGAFVGLLFLCFSSCASSPKTICLPTPPESRLGKSFTVSPQYPWHHTGIQVRKGAVYRITSAVPEGADYRDASFRCSPDGPDRLPGLVFDRLFRRLECPVRPMHHFSPGTVKRLRVLEDSAGRRASFLTLMATVGERDDPEWAQTIGSDGIFTAPENGELVLFANDWPGGTASCGNDRFYDDQGKLNSPTYLNNRGCLEVAVTPLPRIP